MLLLVRKSVVELATRMGTTAPRRQAVVAGPFSATLVWATFAFVLCIQSRSNCATGSEVLFNTGKTRFESVTHERSC